MTEAPVGPSRPPGVLRSERLDLELLPPAFLVALLDGRRDEAEAIVSFPVPAAWPEAHGKHFELRRDQMARDASTEGWLVRAMVLREPRRAVGRIGFHGPPGVNGLQASDAVEIGYDVDAEERGKGYATEAAGALIRWALAQPGIARVLASISPGNPPSLAVARKLGFVQVGTQWDDEDGEELVFEVREG